MPFSHLILREWLTKDIPHLRGSILFSLKFSYLHCQIYSFRYIFKKSKKTKLFKQVLTANRFFLSTKVFAFQIHECIWKKSPAMLSVTRSFRLLNLFYFWIYFFLSLSFGNIITFISKEIKPTLLMQWVLKMMVQWAAHQDKLYT